MVIQQRRPDVVITICFRIISYYFIYEMKGCALVRGFVSDFDEKAEDGTTVSPFASDDERKR